MITIILYNQQQQTQQTILICSLLPKMNRTPSKVGLAAERCSDLTLNRSHSQKMYYINDELCPSSRDVATIFHSPYKNGKRNENYVNPTFVSSNLFYSQQQVKKQLAPKHNLIYNKNQRSRRDLYAKRIQRQDYIANTVHKIAANDLTANRQRQRFNQESCLINRKMGRSSSKSGFKQENNDVMQRELENLIVHREKEDRKQQELIQRMNTCIQQDDHRSIEHLEQVLSSIKEHNAKWDNYYKESRNKNNREWANGNNKIKQLKIEEEHRINSNVGNNNNNNSNDHNDNKVSTLTKQQMNVIKHIQCQKHNNLLGNILRQQIKQSQNNKKKQKKQRNQFY